MKGSYFQHEDAPPVLPMGRFLLLTAFAGFLLTAVAPPARAQAPRPDGNLAVMLIRDALTALNQANWTGNYTVLRDYASPNFAKANDPVRLTTIFKPIRARGIDLAPALFLAPKITTAEMVQGGRRLTLAGFFPSKPRQINFNLVFESVNKRWRLFGITVSTSEDKPEGETAKVPGQAGEKPGSVPIPKPKPASN